MSAQPDFEPRQIVYLEHQASRLYAEVVQIASARQLCWARPLMLHQCCAPDELLVLPEEWDTARSRLYDLRQGADLLWPVGLFRRAFDTEVMPLLARLYDPGAEQVPLADHQQLRSFMEQVWEAHVSQF